MGNKVFRFFTAAILIVSLPAVIRAVTIIPTYVNGAGQTWTDIQKGVIQQAINDWQTALPDSHTINVTFDFTNAGTGSYLGQWYGSYQGMPYGTDIYPWTTQVTQQIHFNADLFLDTGSNNFLWWDSSPTTSNDLLFRGWDALSVARHEIGHMMGITKGLYKDNIGLGDVFDKWESHIVGTTFDPGGLNVPLAAANDLAHILDSGTTAGDLMVPALVNGSRRGISATDLNMLHLAYNYTVVPPPVSTSYTLTAVVGKTAIHAGGSCSITATIKNIGTGTADTLDFASLRATAASPGTITGSSTSGGPLALGGSASNSGLTFTSSSAGTYTIAPAINSATNHVLGSAATQSTVTSATVTVYSGQGVWNVAGSGSWLTAGNWTTSGGVPGIDGTLSAADTAYFNQTYSSPATVSLNNATPRLAKLDLNTYGSSFTIARGTGANGTLTLQASSGDALVRVYNGTNIISAPVVLGSDAWIGANYWASINFSGGISGNHTLTVVSDITASSIQVDTLRIGNYAPQAAAVPEPPSLVLVGFISVMTSIVVGCRLHRSNKPVHPV